MGNIRVNAPGTVLHVTYRTPFPVVVRFLFFFFFGNTPEKEDENQRQGFVPGLRLPMVTLRLYVCIAFRILPNRE